jgi:TPR repeat protein
LNLGYEFGSNQSFRLLVVTWSQPSVNFLLAGNMYLKGQAVEQNYKLALQYFQMGVKKGKNFIEAVHTNSFAG